ncbi:MAG: N-acetylmuramoyl-L-alanine amidase [Bacteroidota bacterium]
MLGKFFAALSSFFSSLFGTKKKTTGTSSPTATNEGSGTTRPTPTPPTTTLPPPAPDEPQDASELQPDTVIIVAHEMEEVILLPGEPDRDFDEDIFTDNPEGNEPAPPPPAPEPAPEPDPEPEPAPAPSPAPTGRQPRYLWCLDNGHGSKTAGKRSPVFDDGVTQFLEYRFNRDIVRRISEKLEAEGIQFFNVVPEVDIDNFLEGRVDRANKKASDLPKIFVSVHANAGPAKSSKHWTTDSIKGIETWFFHGSKKGQRIAAVFQRHLVDFTGFNNRHLKSRPERQFYVLRKTRMPAVLTENGFYNNRFEALDLMKEEVREQVADAHVAAIVEIEENGI